MMINLSKSDRYSLRLEVDKEGCGLMLQAYQDALQHQPKHLPVTLDKRVFTHSLGSTEAELVVVQSEEADKLIIEDRLVMLYLDAECIVYGIERFAEGLSDNVIFPSELCDVSLKEASVTIYCLLLNTGMPLPLA